MSSWVVLLVALAACLRFGSAQSEPLPLSLVDLVMNSPISSMEDLQKLLDVESVEEEEDEVHSNGTHKRLPRSLAGVQVAQQAMCKVRTEVMEVTRSMLDRRNANFLLLPLCVEVQRCSGCCNSRAMQCVPVATETRHLQMTKIQFMNRHPVYEKVIIPVEDHVTCSCQSRAAAPAPRAKNTPPPPPPRLLPKVIPLPSKSKEELHRHDDLKQNQRLHLEDRETQQVQRYTLQPPHTSAAEARAGGEDVQTRRVTSRAPPTWSDVIQPENAQENPPRVGSGGGKSERLPHQRHGYHDHNSHFQGDEATPQLPLSHDLNQKSEAVPPHSGQLEAPVLTYTHVEVIGQSRGQSKLPGRQLVTPSIHGSQSEVGSQPHSQSDHAELQEKLTKLQSSDQGKSDTEPQQKQSQHHHHHHHHHHQNQHQTQTTGYHQDSIHRAVTNAPPTAPPTPQQPPPPTTERRRRRKQRRRMSKTAMRAMIMVMS